MYSRIEFPEYQREPNIWSLDAKQRLIDSMTRKFDISSLYMYVNDDDSLECVDGRQRIGAIMSFVGANESDEDNGFEYRVLNELYEDENHKFSDLEGERFDDIKEKRLVSPIRDQFVKEFLEYGINVIKLSDSSEGREFNLQFARLNVGTVINAGERLHAMLGDLRNVCFNQLGKHRFLIETNIPARRYSREQLAAQIVAQVFSIEETRNSDNVSYARTRHYEIQGLLKQYAKLDVERNGWIKKASRTMDLLADAFVDYSTLKSRAMVVSTFVLAYEEQFNEVQAKEFARYIDEFIRNLMWQIPKNFEMNLEYRYLVRFQRHLTQASVEKSAVTERAELLSDGWKLWQREKKLKGDVEFIASNPESDPVALRKRD